MRSLRGLALGLLTGTGALVAHAASGGSSTPGAAVAVLALAVGFCWLLAGGRFDPVAAVVIAVGAQAMSHATMSISAAMSASASPSPPMATGMVSVPPGSHPGCPGHGPGYDTATTMGNGIQTAGLDAGAADAVMSHAAHAGHELGLGMLLAHAAVAIITAALCLGLDGLLLDLGAAVLSWILGVVPALRPTPVMPRRPVIGDLALLRSLGTLRRLRARAPPLRAFALPLPS